MICRARGPAVVLVFRGCRRQPGTRSSKLKMRRAAPADVVTVWPTTDEP